MSVAASDQLELEARHGRAAAAGAFAAGLLPVIGIFLRVASFGDDDEVAVARAVGADEGPVVTVASALPGAVAFLLLVPVLWYLYRATRARRPESPSFVLGLLAIGAVVSAAALIAEQILFVDAAAGFAAAADQSEQAADAVVTDAVAIAGGVRLVSEAVLGLALVLIALNAMRAGLLSRFMGIVGIGVGVFYVVRLFDPTPLQLFWLVALGFLFIGRWPNGRGPAWERVEAIPWPTAADKLQGDLAQGTPGSSAAASYGGSTADEDPATAGRGSGGGGGEEAPPDGSDGEAAASAGAAEPAEQRAPRPPSRKRRRGR